MQHFGPGGVHIARFALKSRFVRSRLRSEEIVAGRDTNNDRGRSANLLFDGDVGTKTNHNIETAVIRRQPA